ncbi:MAG: methyltransferase domain-containing protein [Deltaproteobacteria bacterium]|nr:methyltransferase domain-containing protein [Deltaproteobacteria bacterium]
MSVDETKGITLDDQDIEIVNQCIAQNPTILLQCTEIRNRLASARLKRIPKESIRKLESFDAAVIDNAVEHNYEMLLKDAALSRPEQLISVVRSTDLVVQKGPFLKVLSVGPRSEAEIFYLLSVGFHPENIRGLDLISYSPFVDLGDMHSMPYADHSFDVIILGWVLAYSKDDAKVAREVVRVAKPGALIAIGCEYNPLSSQELQDRGGILKTDYPRFQSTQDILKFFDGHVGDLVYKHDIRSDARNQTGAVMAAFYLKN